MPELPLNRVIHGHVLDVLPSFPDGSVDMVMFSPPYWGLRNYGEGTEADWGDWKGQLGLEPHPQLYLDHMTMICHELKRVLKRSGSMYVNMGDTYFGGKGKSGYELPHEAEKRRSMGETLQRSYNVPGYMAGRPQDMVKQDGGWLQPKQKLLMPHRLAIGLQDDGWILRNDIVWHKPNAMPSSVKDRLNCCHEYVFHFVKARRYWYDLDSIREPHKASSISRVSQDLSKQHGGPKEAAYLQDNIIPAGGDVKQISEILKRTKKNILEGKGKNPGDVYQGKFEGFGEESEKFGSPRARTQRLKQDNVPSKNAPTYTGFNARYVPRTDGKNPGDVIKSITAEDRLLGRRPNIQPRSNSRFGLPPTNAGHVLGKNPGDFWSLSTKPFPEAHFAVYPTELCEKPIKSSCPDGGIVLDPFCGAGSTLVAAQKLGRKWIGIDISLEYCEMAKRRIESECAMKLKDWM